jgi:hypothetical protein
MDGRRSLLQLAWATLVAVLATVGCVPGELVVETPRRVALVGRLQEGRVGEWDCAWLVDADGRRFSVDYPPDWDLLLHPVRLVDPSGRVAAKDGDIIRVSGPEVIGESLCSDDVFIAETVEIGGVPHGEARST